MTPRPKKAKRKKRLPLGRQSAKGEPSLFAGLGRIYLAQPASSSRMRV